MPKDRYLLLCFCLFLSVSSYAFDEALPEAPDCSVPLVDEQEIARLKKMGIPERAKVLRSIARRQSLRDSQLSFSDQLFAAEMADQAAEKSARHWSDLHKDGFSYSAEHSPRVAKIEGLVVNESLQGFFITLEAPAHEHRPSGFRRGFLRSELFMDPSFTVHQSAIIEPTFQSAE